MQSLARSAVTAACDQAGILLSDLGAETVLLHIQNGLTCLTPPSGIVLAQSLGLTEVRVLAIDGVCSEPIAAIEIGVLMLSAGRCERVIISAAADFLGVIDPKDVATVGLFGAGAGAMVLTLPSDGENPTHIHSLQWQTHTKYADLGRIPIHGYQSGSAGVQISAGFYEMDGQGLARAALRVLPGVLGAVLKESQWRREDIGLVIAHQPNAKLLDIGVRALRLDPKTVPMPVCHLGNMGPASLLVNLSLAKEQGLLIPELKVLLLAFGLGFSCGAAAVEW
ncbi:3-oxoacyl-ACP synthase III family protein [Pseudonocardia sp. GCM10023141]|uniref:3-oxoacyl-ACP synthase III family protein n=1 Tax=Pseudonocardia sp. GCM10023141 TaxID=3252653 RepID=UPI003605EA0B